MAKPKEKKGTYRERPCIDCGKVTMMYYSRKRCLECARRHFLEYQREYSKALWAERKEIRRQERERQPAGREAQERGGGDAVVVGQV